MNYLGIDYGLRHIGLALATSPIPEPLPTIHYRQHYQALRLLDQVIDKYQVTHLVLGISESFMADQTRSFQKKLQSRYSLPVILVDETLSSYEARQQLAHVSTSKKKNLIHSASAVIILNRYLEKNPISP